MPTYKQKLVASKMVENGGNIGKAMIGAGYSKAMAKNPYKLTRSKGWLEATEEMLSNEEMVKTHAEILESVKVNKFTFSASMGDNEIRSIIEFVPEAKVTYIKHTNGVKTCLFTTPDNSTRLKALALAYKVKGLLNTSKRNHCRVEDNSSISHEEIERFVTWVRKTIPM